MKTRVIQTEIFRDEIFNRLNADTKYLYLTVILNPDISQTRIYKCPDRFLGIYAGMTSSQLDKCKDDLEIAGLAFFKDGWICIASDIGYIESHYGGSKNIAAQVKEFESIPKVILKYFLSRLSTVGIEYQYTIDTTINLNNKSKSKSKSNEKIKESDERAKEFFNALKN